MAKLPTQWIWKQSLPRAPLVDRRHCEFLFAQVRSEARQIEKVIGFSLADLAVAEIAAYSGQIVEATLFAPVKTLLRAEFFTLSVKFGIKYAQISVKDTFSL